METNELTKFIDRIEHLSKVQHSINYLRLLYYHITNNVAGKIDVKYMPSKMFQHIQTLDADNIEAWIKKLSRKHGFKVRIANAENHANQYYYFEKK